jgi:hypothetical protein
MSAVSESSSVRLRINLYTSVESTLFSLNIVVKWLALLLQFQKVLHLILGLETNYSN